MQGMEAIIAWALTPSVSNAVHPHISMLEQQAVTSALEKIRLGVTELDLDNAGISDAGMTVIAQALRHSRLRTLSLSRNALGDAGALRLAEALPHCGEHLTHLKLHNNMIGEVGASGIARALSSSKIRWFWLSENITLKDATMDEPYSRIKNVFGNDIELYFQHVDSKSISGSIGEVQPSAVDSKLVTTADRDFGTEAAFFQENGFALVKGSLTQKLLSHLGTVRRAMEEGGEAGFRNPWKNWTKEFDIAADQLRKYPEIHSLLYSPTLKSAAAALLNANPKRICVVVDKIFAKESGDEETHWHTDSGATEVKDSVEALTAWIPFQDTSARNGLLRFGVGSHMKSGLSGEKTFSL